MKDTLRCMKYKCKVCPKNVECTEKQKQERLMYRPFENLLEILKQGDENDHEENKSKEKF